MLPTLEKIGEHLLEGKGIWSKLTSEPRFDLEKRIGLSNFIGCETGISSILENEKNCFLKKNQP